MYTLNEGMYSPILVRQELEVWCRWKACWPGVRPEGSGSSPVCFAQKENSLKT